MTLPRAPQTRQDSEVPDIYALSEVLRGVAKDLAAVAEAPFNVRSENLTLAQLARSVQRQRRKRDALFPGLFADPAWDILLDLFAAKREGKAICVSSACIAAGVPQTTGLRWIRRLASEGLILREGDSSDARRAYVRISAVADAALAKCLQGPALF